MLILIIYQSNKSIKETKMPKIICKVKVDWSNGKLITNPDGSTYWTGARAVLPVQTEVTDIIGYEDVIIPSETPEGKPTTIKKPITKARIAAHGLDYEEAGIHKGGFDGWVNLPEVEKTKADYAEVYLWCPEETVKEMDAADNKDFEIMALLDNEAQALKEELLTVEKI